MLVQVLLYVPPPTLTVSCDPLSTWTPLQTRYDHHHKIILHTRIHTSQSSVARQCAKYKELTNSIIIKAKKHRHTRREREKERKKERRSVWKLACLNNLTHHAPGNRISKFRTEERGKKAPTKTQWKRRRQRRPHTHTKREEKRERDGDNLHDVVAMTSGAHKLPDPQNRIPAKWIPGANACIQHVWKQTKEIKKRANALQKHQSAKP